MAFTHGPDFKAIYANNSGVTTSPWDFFLRFGTIQVANSRVSIQESVGVYMTPPHAKALLHLLADQIARYEQSFGPIVMPRAAEEDKKKAIKP